MTPDQIVTEQDNDELERQAYNSIVYGAQLRDIALISSNFEVKPQYFSARLENAQLNHAINMEFSEPSYDDESGLLLAQMDWSVTAKKGRSQHLKLTARYMLTYSGVPSVESRHMSEFIRRVGRFATYPYFRNFVSQMSWASGAELPILPVLKQELGGLRRRD
jgi:hypothetical protein